MSIPAPFQNLPGVAASDEPARLERYEIPERGPPGRAACVLVPQDETAVATILAAAQAHRLPLVLSAGRTGLVEAQRPDGESVLSLEKLNRILSIEPDARRATVEAGVAVDTLNAALEPHGLVWPMEMGSTSAATVGACIANGSAGANAVRYGTAAHLCEQASGFWADGSAAGPCAGPSWRKPPEAALAINSGEPDPALGLIGTQGVLGVITRATLRLHPLPQQREAALIPAADMPAAMAVLKAARDTFGDAVEEFEFISASAMNLVRLARGGELRLPFEQDPQTPYYLLLQLASADTPEADDLPGRLYAFLSETLQLPDAHVGYAPLKALKEIRHSITESSNRRMWELGGGRLSFDTATPCARFGAYLDELAAEIRRSYPGIEFAAFGHAGVGGAHLHLLGTRERPVAAHAAELVQLVFDVTQAHGGAFSAEHGVGTKWGDEYLRRTPPEAARRFLAAKHARDPAGILSPRSFGFDRTASRG